MTIKIINQQAIVKKDCLQYVKICCSHLTPLLRQIRYPTITNPPNIPTNNPSSSKINLNCFVFNALIILFFILIPHFEDIINYSYKKSKLFSDKNK